MNDFPPTRSAVKLSYQKGSVSDSSIQHSQQSYHLIFSAEWLLAIEEVHYRGMLWYTCSLRSGNEAVASGLGTRL